MRPVSSGSDTRGPQWAAGPSPCSGIGRIRTLLSRWSGCNPVRRLPAWPTELLMSPSSASRLTISRFAETLIGTERRYAAVAATDPLARRRFLRMADFAGRALAVDSRTGTTSADLWSPEAQPATLRPVQGVDDWLTLISTGQAMGMSSEATATQYPRPGVAYKVVRDAPPISVFLAYWKDDPSVLITEFARLARQAYGDGG
jgi:hypothetical protein